MEFTVDIELIRLAGRRNHLRIFNGQFLDVAQERIGAGDFIAGDAFRCGAQMLLYIFGNIAAAEENIEP